LLFLAIFNAALVFVQCFADLTSGLYNMILVMILFCTVSNMNFCCLAMYMVYITLNWLQLVCQVGLIIQDGQWHAAYNTSTSVAF
jgi:hypothetical protein